jgi:hypothetical protein
MPRAFPFQNADLARRARQFVRHPAVLGCLFWAIVVGVAWAADCILVTERHGPDPFGGFGASIARSSRVAEDGTTSSSLIVGAPGLAGNPMPAAGSVFVLDGVTFLPIRTHRGAEPWDLFGWAVSVLGDQNGDGIPDYMVGSPGWDADSDVRLSIGRAYIYDGGGGPPIGALEGRVPGAEFGFSLSRGFDLDGDAATTNDYAVGAPGDLVGTIERRGAVYVYLGGHPAPITLTGAADGDRFGHAVAILPVSDPRRALIVVGAPGADSPPPGPVLPDVGAVYLYRSDGLLQAELRGSAQNDRFGSSVAVTGDVDRDGQLDLAVGATTSGRGRVTVYSGRSLQPLYEQAGQTPDEELGYSLAGVGDMTNDSNSDIVYTSPGFSVNPLSPVGMARVVHGGTGMELCRPVGQEPGERFGHAIADAGDLDGDGLHEVWISAPGSSSSGVPSGGTIRLYTVIPGPPLGAVDITDINNDDASDVETFHMTWDYPLGACAGVDFAVYRGRFTQIPYEGTDLEIETCSTGGANSVTLPVPPIFPPGTCFVYIVATLNANEESLGQADATTEQRSQARVPCRVFLNPTSCP